MKNSTRFSLTTKTRVLAILLAVVLATSLALVLWFTLSRDKAEAMTMVTVENPAKDEGGRSLTLTAGSKTKTINGINYKTEWSNISATSNANYRPFVAAGAYTPDSSTQPAVTGVINTGTNDTTQAGAIPTLYIKYSPANADVDLLDMISADDDSVIAKNMSIYKLGGIESLSPTGDNYVLTNVDGYTFVKKEDSWGSDLVQWAVNATFYLADNCTVTPSEIWKENGIPKDAGVYLIALYKSRAVTSKFGFAGVTITVYNCAILVIDQEEVSAVWDNDSSITKTGNSYSALYDNTAKVLAAHPTTSTNSTLGNGSSTAWAQDQLPLLSVSYTSNTSGVALNASGLPQNAGSYTATISSTMLDNGVINHNNFKLNASFVTNDQTRPLTINKRVIFVSPKNGFSGSKVYGDEMLALPEEWFASGLYDYIAGSSTSDDNKFLRDVSGAVNDGATGFLTLNLLDGNGDPMTDVDFTTLPVLFNAQGDVIGYNFDLAWMSNDSLSTMYEASLRALYAIELSSGSMSEAELAALVSQRVASANSLTNNYDVNFVKNDSATFTVTKRGVFLQGYVYKDAPKSSQVYGDYKVADHLQYRGIEYTTSGNVTGTTILAGDVGIFDAAATPYFIKNGSKYTVAADGYLEVGSYRVSVEIDDSSLSDDQKAILNSYTVLESPEVYTSFDVSLAPIALKTVEDSVSGTISLKWPQATNDTFDGHDHTPIIWADADDNGLENITRNNQPVTVLYYLVAEGLSAAGFNAESVIWTNGDATTTIPTLNEVGERWLLYLVSAPNHITEFHAIQISIIAPEGGVPNSFTAPLYFGTTDSLPGTAFTVLEEGAEGALPATVTTAVELWKYGAYDATYNVNGFKGGTRFTLPETTFRNAGSFFSYVLYRAEGSSWVAVTQEGENASLVATAANFQIQFETQFNLGSFTAGVYMFKFTLPGTGSYAEVSAYYAFTVGKATIGIQIEDASIQYGDAFVSSNINYTVPWTATNSLLSNANPDPFSETVVLKASGYATTELPGREFTISVDTTTPIVMSNYIFDASATAKLTVTKREVTINIASFNIVHGTPVPDDFITYSQISARKIVNSDKPFTLQTQALSFMNGESNWQITGAADRYPINVLFNDGGTIKLYLVETGAVMNYIGSAYESSNHFDYTTILTDASWDYYTFTFEGEAICTVTADAGLNVTISGPFKYDLTNALQPYGDAATVYYGGYFNVKVLKLATDVDYALSIYESDAVGNRLRLLDLSANEYPQNVGWYIAVANGYESDGVTIDKNREATLLFRISPAPVTIVVGNANVTYGTNYTGTPSVSWTTTVDYADSFATTVNGVLDAATFSYAGYTTDTLYAAGTKFDISINAVFNSNFTPNPSTGALTVVPIQIAVSPKSGAITYGQSVPVLYGTPSANVTASDLFDETLIDDLTGIVDQNVQFSLVDISTAAAYAGNVGIYRVIYSTKAGANNNYAVNVANVMATVSVSAQTLTLAINGGEQITLTYGDTIASGYLNGKGSISGVIGSDDVSVNLTSDAISGSTTANVGTYPINVSLTGTSASNYVYALASGSSLTVQVAPKLITWAQLTSDEATKLIDTDGVTICDETHVYNGSEQTHKLLLATNVFMVSSNDLSIDRITCGYALRATNANESGHVAYLEIINSNYDWADDVKSQSIYDGTMHRLTILWQLQKATPVVNYSISGRDYNGQALATPTLDDTFGASTVVWQYKVDGSDQYLSGMPKDQGTYVVKATIPAAANWNAANLEKSVTITAKQVKVSANAQVAYGTKVKDIAWTLSYNGFIEGEQPTVSGESSVTGISVYGVSDPDAILSVVASGYDVVISGVSALSAANYQFIVDDQNGKLTITQKYISLSLSITDEIIYSKAVSFTKDHVVASAGQFENGDTVDVLSNLVFYIAGSAVTDTQSLHATTYEVNATATATNYNVTISSTNIVVKPLAVTVTISPEQDEVFNNSEINDLKPINYITIAPVSGGTLPEGSLYSVSFTRRIINADGEYGAAQICEASVARQYAGFYTVLVTLTNTDITTESSLLATYTIDKQSVSLPTIDSKVYTGKVLTPNVTTSSLYNVTYASDIKDVTEDGYDVVYSLTDTVNYKWDGVNGQDYTVKFYVTKATITITVADSSIQYGSATTPLQVTTSQISADTSAEIDVADITLTTEAHKDGYTNDVKDGGYGVIAELSAGLAQNYNAVVVNESNSATVITVYAKEIAKPTFSDGSTTKTSTYSATIQSEKVINGNAEGLLVSVNESVASIPAGDDYTYYVENAGIVILTYTLGNSNYAFVGGGTSVQLTWTMNKADVTIEVQGTLSVVYDGEAHSIVANVPSWVAAEDVTVTYGGSADAPINANTYAIVVSVAENDNYNSATDSSKSLVISKAELTVTVSTKNLDGTAYYNDAWSDDPQFQYAVTGWTKSADETSLLKDGVSEVNYVKKIGSATGEVFTGAQLAANTYYVTSDSFKDEIANYTVSVQGVEVVVHRRQLEKSLVSVAATTYNGQEQAASTYITLGGNLAQYYTAGKIQATGYGNYTNASEDGYDVVFTINDSNLVWEGSVTSYTVKFVIHKAPLTVDVNDIDDAIYAVGVPYQNNATYLTVTGLVGSDVDDLSVLKDFTFRRNGLGVFAADDTKNWAAGEYTVTPSCTADNYVVTPVSGKLIINKLQVTITLTPIAGGEYGSVSGNTVTVSVSYNSQAYIDESENHLYALTWTRNRINSSGGGLAATELLGVSDSKVDAGIYSITLRLLDSNCELTNASTQVTTYTITKKTILKPSITNTAVFDEETAPVPQFDNVSEGLYTAKYDGKELREYTFVNGENAKLSPFYNAKTSYQIDCVIIDSDNMQWAGGADTVQVPFTVQRKGINASIDPIVKTYGEFVTAADFKYQTGYLGSFNIEFSDENVVNQLLDVGTYYVTVTLSGEGAGNYVLDNAGQPLSAVITINPKLLAVPHFDGEETSVKTKQTAFNGSQITLKVVGGNAAGLTAVTTVGNPISGGVQNDILYYETNVSTNKFVYSLSSTNYAWDDGTGNASGNRNSVELVWEITQATTQITANDSESVEYTGANCIVPFTVSQFVDASDVSVQYEGSGSTTYAASATAPKNVGTYTVTVTVAESALGNYTSASKVIALSITPKTLVITPYGSSTYGDAWDGASATLGYTFGEFATGDSQSVVTVPATASYVLMDGATAVASGKNDLVVKEGNYVIKLAANADGTLIGFSADNYKIIGAEGEYEIEKLVIDESSYSISSQIYNGQEVAIGDITINNADADVAYFTKEFKDGVEAKNAATYKVVLTLKVPSSMSWKNVNIPELTLDFVIEKADYSFKQTDDNYVTIQGWAYGDYDATYHSPSAEANVNGNIDNTRLVFTYSRTASGTYSATLPVDAGDAYVRLEMPETQNYNAWTSPATQFAVSPKIVNLPALNYVTEGNNQNTTYTGSSLNMELTVERGVVLNAPSGMMVQVSGGKTICSVIDAGDYVITFQLDNPDEHTNNYVWDTNAPAEKKITWTVEQQLIALPSYEASGYSYTGNQLTLTIALDPMILRIESTNTEFSVVYTASSAQCHVTNAGNYAFKFVLVQPQNYKISEDDSADGNWSVAKANPVLELHAISVTYGDQYDVAASAKSPAALTYTYYQGSDPDGDVSHLTVIGAQKPKNQGVYTVLVEIAEDDNYFSSSITAQITITRARLDVVPAGSSSFGTAWDRAGNLSYDFEGFVLGESKTLVTIDSTKAISYKLTVSAGVFAAAGATTLTARAYDLDIIYEDGTFTAANYYFVAKTGVFNVNKIVIDETAFSIAAQTFNNTVVTAVPTIIGAPTNHAELFSAAFQADVEVKNAATYKVVLTLLDPASTEWKNVKTPTCEIDFVINKADYILAPDASGHIIAIADGGWTYGDANVESKITTQFASNGNYLGTPARFTYGTSQTGDFYPVLPQNVGTYYVRVEMLGNANYNAYTMTDISSYGTFTIQSKQVAKPALAYVSGANQNIEYTGLTLTMEIVLADGVSVKTIPSGMTATATANGIACQVVDAGTYTMWFSLNNPDEYTHNYVWADGGLTPTADVSLDWQVAPKSVVVPGIANDYTYTGNILYLDIALDASVINVTNGTGDDGDVRITYTGSGALCQTTNAGTYTLNFHLTSSNYIWMLSNGTLSTSDQSGDWLVKKATPVITLADITAEYGDDYSVVPSTTFGTVTYKYFKEGTEIAKPVTVGTYQVVAEVASSDNWNAATPVTKTITITPATLTVTPNGSVVYGTAWNDCTNFAPVISGYKLGENATTANVTINSDALSGTVPSYIVEGKASGEILATGTVYKLVMGVDANGHVNGFSAPNYVFVGADGEFIVNKLVLDESLITVADQNYTYNGYVFNTGLTDGTYYTVSGHENVKDAKTYEITVSLNNENVKWTNVEGSDYIIRLTVEKRNVKVRINNVTVIYSQEPTLTYALSSGEELAANDTLQGLGISVAVIGNKVGGYYPAGTYYIESVGYTNTNYNITFENGLLTVDQFTVDVSFTTRNGVYGQKVADIRYTITPTISITMSEDLQNEINSAVKIRYGSGTVTLDTPASTYSVSAYADPSSNIAVSATSFSQFVVEKQIIDETAIIIPSQVYTGSILTPQVSGDAFQADFDRSIINAGSYDVTLTLVDPDNTRWKNVTEDYCIKQFVVEKAANTFKGELVMNGWEYGLFDAAKNMPSIEVVHEGSVRYTYAAQGSSNFTTELPVNGAAGEYWVRAEILESDNYKPAASGAVVEKRFTITPRIISSPQLNIITDGDKKNDTYTGEVLVMTIYFADDLMRLVPDEINGMTFMPFDDGTGGNVMVTNANVEGYIITFVLRNSRDYVWASSTTDAVQLKWIVARKQIARPTQSDDDTFFVNGELHTYNPNGYNKDTMTIINNATTEGGIYDAIVSISDKLNYEWIGGGQDDISFEWWMVGKGVIFAAVFGTLTVSALVVGGVFVARIVKHRKFQTNTQDMPDDEVEGGSEPPHEEQPQKDEEPKKDEE